MSFYKEEVEEVINAVYKVTGDINVAKVLQQVKDLPIQEERMNIADDLNHAYHDGYEAAKRDVIKAISSIDDYTNSWVTYAIDEAISMIKELPKQRKGK